MSALNGTTPSQTATGQLQWNHSDASFDWRTLTLADYGREAELGSNTTGDIINTMDVRLDRVRDAGKKILMWQGTADQLITAENGLEYYTRAGAYFGKGTPDFSVLQSWWRYFRMPGVAHCGGGAGPQPNQEAMFQQMVTWVENVCRSADGTHLRRRPHAHGLPLPPGSGLRRHWQSQPCLELVVRRQRADQGEHLPVDRDSL
jgi:hypothetical protein